MLPCNSSLSSKETERERLDILRQILPENYKYMVNEFYIKKRPQIAGETTFNTTFRVNITDKYDIQIFISKLGEKSVTANNRYCGDIHRALHITHIVEIFMVPVKRVVTRGNRKCQHFVKRYHLKTNAPHKGPGRQPGSECVPGKNTGCPAKLKFTLSGSTLHTSN